MTDPSGHLDLDALADVLAGEHDDAHLRSCSTCADRLAQLSAADASTAAALAALPVPAMPDGLSLRLAQALEEERQREPAAARPLRRPARHRAPTWLPAVAAAAAVVLAGGVGWSLLDLSGGAGQDAATSAAGGAGPESAGGGGSGGGAEDTGSRAQPESAAGLALPRTDWADAVARTAALEQLLAAEPAGSSALAVPSGDELDRLRDPAALAACLHGLPRGGDDVLAVDYASYAGTPAVAVVQPAGPAQVVVTVVAGGCTAADPQLLDELRLPRP